jgi:hypothetical protein
MSRQKRVNTKEQSIPNQEIVGYLETRRAADSSTARRVGGERRQ